jgi:hypothetical protein
MRSLYFPLLFGALLVAACNSNDDDNATPTGGGGGGGSTTQLTPTTPCSVQMTENGTAVSVVGDGMNFDCINGSSGDATAKSYKGSIGDGNNGTTIDIELGKFPTGQSVGLPTDSAFLSFFHTGSWTYGDVNAANNVVTVSSGEFIGSDYFIYSSANGSQTGSSFEITELLPVDSEFSDAYVVVRVTFNCKLYSDGGTLVKTITNGTAVVSMSNI